MAPKRPTSQDSAPSKRVRKADEEELTDNQIIQLTGDVEDNGEGDDIPLDVSSQIFLLQNYQKMTQIAGIVDKKLKELGVDIDAPVLEYPNNFDKEAFIKEISLEHDLDIKLVSDMLDNFENIEDFDQFEGDCPYGEGEGGEGEGGMDFSIFGDMFNLGEGDEDDELEVDEQ